MDKELQETDLAAFKASLDKLPLQEEGKLEELAQPPQDEPLWKSSKDKYVTALPNWQEEHVQEEGWRPLLTPLQEISI